MDGTATLRNDDAAADVVGIDVVRNCPSLWNVFLLPCVVVVVVFALWVALSSGLLFHRGNMLVLL